MTGVGEVQHSAFKDLNPKVNAKKERIVLPLNDFNSTHTVI